MTSSPLTAADLLVSLHDIDLEKNAMKTVIMATGYCFEKPNVFTHEVLALVLQQLVERDPLPILIMRTVMQSLSMFPTLLGYVITILNRLVQKKVWLADKRVWDGFVRTCDKTEPQSLLTLLRLDPPQLREVFHSVPRLRTSLLNLVLSYGESDRSGISPEIMQVLTTEPVKEVSAPPPPPVEARQQHLEHVVKMESDDRGQSPGQHVGE